MNKLAKTIATFLLGLSLPLVGFATSTQLAFGQAAQPGPIRQAIQQAVMSSDLFQQRKDKIISQIEKVDAVFDNVIARVTAADRIKPENRDRILGILNDRKTRLDAIKTTLQSATRPEDVRNALTELRTLIKNSREDFQKLKERKQASVS